MLHPPVECPLIRKTKLGTDTLTDRTETSAFGSALKANDERAMAISKTIKQEERKADVLLIRDQMLCMSIVSVKLK
jgi:hypothetical protein